MKIGYVPGWSRTLFCCCTALVFAWSAGANTIIVQPVLVAGAADTRVTDVLFADAIFAQIGDVVQLLPELVSNSLSPDMIASGIGSNLSSYFSDITFQQVPVLTIWYVSSINGAGSGVRGVSFSGGGNKYGIGIANSHSNDTFAHEIAHVLTDFLAYWQPNSSDQAHSLDPYNLLASGGIRYVPNVIGDVSPQGLKYDRIEGIQSIFMGTSPFVIADEVPEASSGMLFCCGLVSVFVVRRNIHKLRPH